MHQMKHGMGFGDQSAHLIQQNLLFVLHFICPGQAGATAGDPSHPLCRQMQAKHPSQIGPMDPMGPYIQYGVDSGMVQKSGQG